MNNLKALLLSALLASVVWLNACTPPSWFNTAEGIATVGVTITTTLVSNLEPNLQPQSQKVLADFNLFKTDLNAYIALPSTTTLGAVQNVFTVLSADDTALLSAFNVSNQHTDLVITSIIAAVDAAVTSIAALIPPPVVATLSAPIKARAAKGSSIKTSKDLKVQYNDAVKGDKRFKPIKLTIAEKL